MEPRLVLERRYDASAFLEVMSKSTKLLDHVNIKILSAMGSLGPRNLLEVSRVTKLPASTVYSRVSRLTRITDKWLVQGIPAHSKLGLQRLTVLVQSAPGMESLVEEALKLPNYWSLLSPAEGFYNHLSIHAIPVEAVRKFSKYLDLLRNIGIIRKYQLLRTTNYHPVFPAFDDYDPHSRSWRFRWRAWLRMLTTGDTKSAISDPDRIENLADKSDILILKELEKNAMRRYSQLAKMLGVTLQAVKYRFDKRIYPRGLIEGFAFRMLPYPSGIADLREIRIDFKSAKAMNRFYSNANRRFVMRGLSKIIGENSLLVRTFTPRFEERNLFALLSELVRVGAATDYSVVRLDFENQRSQTLSYELFDDATGWQFDSDKLASSVRRLVAHPSVRR